jgi:hypothetical protein
MLQRVRLHLQRAKSCFAFVEMEDIREVDAVKAKHDSD